MIKRAKNKKLSMEPIKNLNELTIEQINSELEPGIKFVVSQYCISLLLVSFKRNMDIFY